MRSSFSRCGRYAFARGNSAWARNFNFSLHTARGSVPMSFASAPFTWRMLASASPMMSNAVSVMMAASESPASVGFAEQAGCIQSGMMCSTESNTEEVAESGDDTANVLSSAPAGSHITLLKKMSMTHYSENRESRLSLPSRPLLVAKADSIQSRLSQLAAALSPSHSLTPVSRREAPTTSASPIVNRELSFEAPGFASSSARVKHYPIDTPPFDFEDNSNVLVDEAKFELEKYWKVFEGKSTALLAKLQTENERKELIKKELLDESTKREKEMMNEALLAISKMDLNLSNLEQETLSKVENRIAAFQQQEREQRRQEMVDHVAQIGKAKMDEIKKELHRIEAEKNDAQQTVDVIVSMYLDRIEGKIEDEVSKLRPASSSLVEENQKLRSLVRKMKIALSKWRVDYMQHAQDLQDAANEQVVAQPVQPPSAPPSIAGEHFSKHSQTLSKLWTACGPSNTELVEFLARIEQAVNNGKDLAQVYKTESLKTIEKLPLAQLAARREFLLAKSSTTISQRQELDEVNSELASLIFDYEQKHGHSFVYDGQEYGRDLERVQIRDN